MLSSSSIQMLVTPHISSTRMRSSGRLINSWPTSTRSRDGGSVATAASRAGLLGPLTSHTPCRRLVFALRHAVIDAPEVQAQSRPAALPAAGGVDAAVLQDSGYRSDTFMAGDKHSINLVFNCPSSNS